MNDARFLAFAAEVKDLCKSFSDLNNRPYMGDVTAAIDSLAEMYLNDVDPHTLVPDQFIRLYQTASSSNIDASNLAYRIAECTQFLNRKDNEGS